MIPRNTMEAAELVISLTTFLAMAGIYSAEALTMAREHLEHEAQTHEADRSNPEHVHVAKLYRAAIALIEFHESGEGKRFDYRD